MEDKKVKLRIDKFYKNEEQQYIFLRRLALTFRARLPLLSELFHIDEEELFNKLRMYNRSVEDSLKYLYYFDISDQEEAKRNIIAFYQELLTAVVKKDKETQKFLIGIIADSRIKSLIKEKHLDRNLSDEEILVILEYQLKYALDHKDAAGMLGINPENYRRRVLAVISGDEELKTCYERLMDYNQHLFLHTKKPKRG